MKHFASSILFLCLFLHLPAAYAQNAKTAKAAFDSGDYFDAIEQYGKLLEMEPENYEYNSNMGFSYLRTNMDPMLALDYLIAAEKTAKPGDDLPLHIAEAYMHHLEYELASEYLTKYQKEGKNSKKNAALVEMMKTHCQAAPDLLKFPADVDFINAGSEINSPNPDYLPYISAKGDMMIFTSRRKSSPASKPEVAGYYASNIFSATLAGGKWTASILERINNGLDEQGIGLSHSGDTLFFSINDMETAGDMFSAVKKAKGYTEIKSLDVIINSPFVESACALSADGLTIIFSSNRTGGSGGFDLWMSKKTAAGAWGEPTNLGPSVNTALDEQYPTLSADGRTLYFSSEGHAGMGGFDLYFSNWDAQSSTWSSPQNMGYPINTPANDKSITFKASGEKAYITALRDDGQGDLDIYEIRFKEINESLPAIFHVNAIGPAGAAVSSKAQIRIKNEFDEVIGEYYPNSVNGRYVIALYPGKYFLELDVPGYRPHSELFVVTPFHKRYEQCVKIINLKQ
jgi:hypothetical protein